MPLQDHSTLAYDNWQAALRGVSLHGTFEYPLFTDCELTGEKRQGLGPYEIINTIADEGAAPTTPRAVLRVDSHPPAELPSLDSPRNEAYHGGLMQDEVAALVSLLLGFRLKAGAASRHFQPNGDPRGDPWAFEQFGRRDPNLLSAGESAVLPRLHGSRELGDLSLLESFPKLSRTAAVAVARAARLYQDAVWIAESEPEISWILLTSAVETAASFHAQASEHPLDLFRAWKPGGAIDQLLSQHELEALVPKISEIVAPYIGATRKFRNFLLTFLPSPPAKRPLEHLQISWQPDHLRRAFGIIYDHRSRALHSGTPFPAPMCWPPRRSGDSYAERIPGTGAGARGSLWTSRDLPMFLSVFEYVVQYALCAWWTDLSERGTTAETSA